MRERTTISDNIVIAWLELLFISFNQLSSIVVKSESIRKETEDLDHGIKIRICNTLCSAEASENCITICRSVDSCVTPGGAVGRGHV